MKELYDKVEAWRDQFDKYSKDPSRGCEEYYRGMASGLTIALLEIDKERYERESKAS